MKTISRRGFLKWTGAGLSTVAFAACAPAAPPSESADTGAQVAVEQGEVAYGAAAWWLNKHLTMETLANQYAEEFPDKPRINLLKVNLEPPKVLLEAQAGQSSLDSYMGVNPAWTLMPLVESDALAVLEDIFPADIREDETEFALRDCSYEDKLMVFPQHEETTAVGYRINMLQEAGFADGPPDDFDAYVECIKTIQETLKTESGDAVYGHTWDPARLWRTVFSVGLALLGEENFYHSDPTVVLNWDHPGMTTWLQHLEALVPYSPPEIFSPGDEYANVFGVGNAAIMWTVGARPLETANVTFGNEDLGLVPSPGFKEPLAGDGNTRCLAFSTGTMFFKHGPHWQDAFDFLSWCWWQESFQMSEVTEGGWLPSAKRVAGADWIPSYLTKEAQIIQDHGVPAPTTPHLITFGSVVGPIVVSYLKKEIATPEEALEQCKSELARAIELEA
jgi:ABC-type glycerol-3-phosphate transport system substrate-binding protein